jgi:hypothetical protein
MAAPNRQKNSDERRAQASTPSRKKHSNADRKSSRANQESREGGNFFVENSLSIILLALFIVFLLGQTFSGLALDNDTRVFHGLGKIGYWEYVRTGTFLQGVFSNWQAAILQLASLIVLGVYLHQRGAPHSRRSVQFGHPERKEKRFPPGDGWIRRNSLSLVFFGLFVVAFWIHLVSGAAAYNQTRAYSHQPPLSIAAFSVSAKFWFSTFQTWQAEYMAIALYVVLSIFLRQEGSPESKPVESSNRETGNPNK